MTSKHLAALCAGLAACATATPPQELVDARATHTRAEQGPAQKYRPDELHQAKVALDQAEESFRDDAHGEKTVTLAYVANRRAQMAEVDGVTARANNDTSKATSELTQVATSGMQRAQGELTQTRQQLAAESQARADAEKARADAEKRAKDALDKLALASVPVKQETRGMVITLPGSVLFASNKSTLLPSAQDKLNQVADALKDQTDRQISIEGYTDSRGSDTTNQALSESRAQSVRSYLVSRGLPDDKVTAIGMGASKPVADNASAEGRADNRRVEIVVKAPPEPK